MVPSGDPVYWDNNGGVGCHSVGCPSLTWYNEGTIPSEAFTVDGTATSSTGSTPEPGSILLFASGLLGVAGLLRRKLYSTGRPGPGNNPAVWSGPRLQPPVSRKEYAMHRLIARALPLLVLFLIALTAGVRAQTYTVIHTFTGGADGANPIAGLTIDRAGNLYGTTFSGGGGPCTNIYGATGCGAVFKLTRAGSGWTLAPLYDFQGVFDGGGPWSGVVLGPDGRLYGTAAAGGTNRCGTFLNLNGCGVVYSLTPRPEPAPEHRAFGRKFRSIRLSAALMDRIRWARSCLMPQVTSTARRSTVTASSTSSRRTMAAGWRARSTTSTTSWMAIFRSPE